jgi:hypothetical protein
MESIKRMNHGEEEIIKISVNSTEKEVKDIMIK